MEQLSGFTYLLGRPTLAQLEIDAGLDHINGEPSTPDTYLPLLGSSFAWAFGRVVNLGTKDRATGADSSARVRERMREAAYAAFVQQASHALERMMLQGPSDADLPALRELGYDPARVRAGTESRLGFERETTQLLAASPQWRRGRLRDAISGRDIVHEWLDIYVRHLQDREQAGLAHELLDAEQMAAFWAAMPQAQVAISMKTRYHRNPARPWKTNDISDIDAMSIAYPYCDVVLTDQEARAALKDSPDLRAIGTYLPRNPGELADWLNDLLVVANTDQQVPHPLRSP